MKQPARAYTVIAEHPSIESVERYIRWLADGHILAVLEGGAERAMVVRIDGEPPVVEVRYIFPSRAAFDRYEADFAPRLRAEGLALFGPGTGVRFRRTLGDVAHEERV